MTDPVTDTLLAVAAFAGVEAGPVAIGTAVSLEGTVAGAAAGFSFSGVAGAIGTSFLVSAASYVLQKALSSGTTASAVSSGDSPANSPQVRFSERQAVPAKRVIYGRIQVGGAVFIDQVLPPFRYLGLLLAVGPVDGIEQVWISTNEVGFPFLVPDTVLIPVTAPYLDAGGVARLRVSFRLGAIDQAKDPILAADMASLDPNFLQLGIATAVVRADYGADFDQFQSLWGASGAVTPLFLVRGKPIYDPRDPTQILGSPETYKWSNNASLVQADYLSAPYGGRIALDRVRWDKVGESADWDDTLMGTVEGDLLKKHTIDGVITLDQAPSDVMQAMLTANRGFVVESAGKVWVSSSKPKTPILTIHDGLIVDGFEYRAAQPKKSLLNRIRSRFVVMENNWQDSDGPILDRVDLQDQDGEVLEATIDFAFSLDNRRVQRLQKAYLETARIGKSVTLRLDLSVLSDVDDEPIGQCVQIDSIIFPDMNGFYLVQSVGFAPDFTYVEFQLAGYDPTIETDWNPATDQQPFVFPTLTPS